MAVEAYKAALLEFTRERVPLDWASTQDKLGRAFIALGVRDKGITKLEAAVHALDAALEERTRNRVPLEWAETQNNLSLALLYLGRRMGRIDQLEAALAAVKNASEVFLNEAGHLHREAELKERIADIEAAIARLS